MNDSFTVSGAPIRTSQARRRSGRRGNTTPLVQSTTRVQRACARERSTKSQKRGCTVGSPPSSCTSKGPSGGSARSKSSSDRNVPPAGDEHVLHQGHARLQWLVSAA